MGRPRADRSGGAAGEHKVRPNILLAAATALTTVAEPIARACGAIVTWVDKGIEAAMNQFNADSDTNKPAANDRDRRKTSD